MSDKSFGDHLNKNIVKNPLLSSAVTGLSLDDLTHKAVLLPAPSQEQITRLDIQQGSQRSALASPEHDIPSFPSGDAFSVQLSTPQSTLNIHDHQNIEKNRNSTSITATQTSTQSKTSVKSEDDFDVNEYIARLQGTRYVSAPLHSHLQDANSNLPEESLEEINLNEQEPERVETQSLTADIAQNFSQLPTVLPHVASAVFSSFSNMLSMRSRETTPEVSYNQAQFERPNLVVPVMETPKDFGLPPKEPPATGISNYRITSKKKYAPIPGLSHGGHSNISNINPLCEPQTNIPPFFTPDASIPQDSKAFNPPEVINQNVFEKDLKTVDNKVHNDIGFGVANMSELHMSQEGTAITGVQSLDKEASVNFNPLEVTAAPTNQIPDYSDITTPRIPIIPPPPMFSNQRRESQTKSVLPPSVARRISANQPLIKQPAPTSTFTDNIFVPTIPAADNSNVTNPVQFFTPNVSTGDTQLPTGVQPDLLPPSVSAIPTPSSILPPETTLFTPSTGPQFAPPPDLFPQSVASIPRESSKDAPVSIPASSYPPSLNPPSYNVPTLTPPQFSDPTQNIPGPFSRGPASYISVPASSGGNLHSVPMFTPQPMNDGTSIASVSEADYVPVIKPDNVLPPPNPAVYSPPSTFFNPEAVKPVDKPLIEPPKATGVNFRLTKKRPQYYAGPIEGIGSISNNVKPVIAPLIPSVPTVEANYLGSYFTPEQKLQVNAIENTAPIPEVPFDINRQTVAQSDTVPFDISKQYLATVENAPQKTSAVAFDINVNPDDHAQQYAPYGYSTAFDFGRNTTDYFEPEKQESKGFGIIGSLKTKLSSIDINKIQNTVTTFFDPAYNESKTDTAAENTAYAPQESGQFSQTNFQISVPSMDSQYQYGFQGYNQDQSQYYQGQTYNYAHSDTQRAYSQPFTQQVFGTEQYTSYNQENIPQNVDLSAKNDTPSVSFYTPLTVQPIEDHKIAKEIPTTAIDNSEVTPKANTLGVIGDAKPASVGEKSYKEVIDTIEPSIDNPLASKYIFDKNAFTENIVNPNLTRFSPPLPPAMSFFDSPQLGDIEKKTDDLAKGVIRMVMADIIPSAHTPVELNDNLSNKPGTDKHKLATGFQSLFTDKTENVNLYPADQENIKKKQPISKTAVEEVAKTSLYGLSTMLADKTHELLDDTKADLPIISGPGIKLASEDQPPFTLFKALAEDIELPKINLSIADVKNVLLIEPPQENIVTVLKRNASSSLLKDLPKVENTVAETSVKDSDINLDKVAPIETAKNNFSLFHDENNGDFFDHLSKVSSHSQSVESASDLSICETCREVNTPEENETEDVTDHLIENVISSIQLSNPVEASLKERKSFTMEEEVVACETIDDINRITEDTIETIQGQQASDPLDEAKPDINYGWATEQLVYETLAEPEPNLTNSDFNLNTEEYNTSDNPEYSYNINPNAIGLLGDNSSFFDNVPNNASDEIKAEFKTHEDILPRQMSIPTAPPEEDTKSDGTGGLDVHSIELDAKKDFPLEEEFIIEPSETDDGKIEFRERKRSSEDSINDTFTNRIEKFKNKSSSDYSYENIYISGAPKSMASYFDTGNFAADTHYSLNALANTQDTNVIGAYETIPPALPVESNEDAFRLPPGFEDELRKQFNELYKPDNYIPSIPDTSTQTKTTVTATFSSPQDKTISTFNTFATESTYSHLTDNFNINAMEPAETIKVDTKSPEVSTCTEKDGESCELPSLLKAFGAEVKNDHNPIGDTIVAKSDEPSKETQPTLADPKKFFSSTEEVKPEQDSFNRLASYFSMTPAQPDHSKSFFELSQSQNHYRHVNATVDQKPNLDDRTRESIHNLMQDLTSTDNISFNENVTINYFFVKYDSVPILAKQRINVESDAKNGHQSRVKSLDKPIDKKDREIDEDFVVKKEIDANESNNSKVKDDNVKLVNSNNPKVNDNITLVSTCELCFDKIDTDSKVRKAADCEGVKGDQMSVSEKSFEKQSETVSVDFGGLDADRDAQDGTTAINESRSTSEYAPVRHHWFYRVDVDEKSVWRGFSSTDSDALEHAYRSPELSEETLIATDGGRFDVNIIGRLRIAVYWKEKPTNVRRCSWFYKGTTDARYVPYTEAVADKLEEEFRHGVTTGEWHRRLVLPNSELVVMHGPAVMVHFLHAGAADSFSSPPSTSRPRVVRRGHEESEIEDSEPSSIDHLLLLCHGVGSACDMRFRSVEEVVEDFRSTSLQLLQSHYRNSYDNGIVNRVEVLPISWHAQLHVGEKGVDKRLSKVTLDSIPRLRAFTNHTVLDALFYTSPVYHQTIIDTVCFELNRIYSLFKKRNPNFKGGVSLGGHSLGSVILYDLLCHQHPEKPITPMSTPEKSYLTGARPALQQYPQLEFPPDALYALGSPIAIFECIRGVEALGMDFALPTCKHFFNIFHPYDPIAYRIEPLVNPALQDAKPFLIPHHKGRKRMHLELKDTMVRVGADLKQKLLESLRTTWNKWKSSPPPDGQLEKVVEEEMEKEQLCDEPKEELNMDSTTPDMLGKLNSGRRIDYVLQEAPLEMINEYLFAMSSHVGYWESEDTMLLMLREIYNSIGVPPDCTVPQQSLTVTRTRQDQASIVNEKEHPSTSRDYNL